MPVDAPTTEAEEDKIESFYASVQEEIDRARQADKDRWLEHKSG